MMWYSFAVDLGAALGPILAYLLNDMWGMDTAYAGTAVLLLILAVKWYWSAPLLKPFVRRSTGREMRLPARGRFHGFRARRFP